MKNMGLDIVNLTIQNFSDNDGVLDTLAVRNIAEKKRDADIARAEAERDTLIRQSIADQEGNKARAEADAHIAEQDKELELRRAEYRAAQDRAKAEADLAYKVQQESSRKALETERAAAEMIRLQKETELQAQQVQIERERLSVEVREKAEAERDAKIAEAEAEKQVIQARADAELYKQEREAQAQLVMTEKEAEAICLRGQAEADAAFIRAQKEAEAIRLKGEAEAEALLKRAEAMKQYGQAAMLDMLIEKLPEMARAVSEPLSKTEKIIFFGGRRGIFDGTGYHRHHDANFEANVCQGGYSKCCGDDHRRHQPGSLRRKHLRPWFQPGRAKTPAEAETAPETLEEPGTPRRTSLHWAGQPPEERRGLAFQMYVCLAVGGQVIPVGDDEVVHHLADGVHVQLAAGMGVQHGGLVDVLLLAGAGSLNGQQLHVDVGHVHGRALHGQERPAEVHRVIDQAELHLRESFLGPGVGIRRLQLSTLPPISSKAAR